MNDNLLTYQNEKKFPFQDKIFAWLERQCKEEQLSEPTNMNKFWDQKPFFPFPYDDKFIYQQPGYLVMWSVGIVLALLNCYVTYILNPFEPTVTLIEMIAVYLISALIALVVGLGLGALLAVPVRFVILLVYFNLFYQGDSGADRRLEQRKHNFLNSQVNRYEFIIDYFDKVLIPDSTEELNNQRAILLTNYITKRTALQTDFLELEKQKEIALAIEREDLVMKIDDSLQIIGRQMEVSTAEQEVQNKIDSLTNKIAFFSKSKAVLIDEKSKVSESGLDLNKISTLLERYGNNDSGYQFVQTSTDPLLIRMLEELENLDSELSQNVIELQTTLPHRGELAAPSRNLLSSSE